MSTSAAFMLLPDNGYKTQRPTITDHHLTVAYFGPVAEISPAGLTALRRSVNLIARQIGEPISATANGVGYFDAGEDGFAEVDLIDGIGSLKVRMILENLFGSSGNIGAYPRISYRHGFTPHMTRSYIERNDAFMGPALIPQNIRPFDFQFVAVGAWIGDEHYEVEL